MKHAFLFLTLLLGISLHAQDVFEMEEFNVSEDGVALMTYSKHENVIMALTSSPQYVALKKYDIDGVLLDSILLWPKTKRAIDFEMFAGPNGQTLVYYVETQIDGDTATFHKVTIGDDMIPVFEDYDWFGLDCPKTLGSSQEVHVLVNKDGGCFLSYSTVQDSIRMVRFDADGMVLAERTIDRYPQISNSHGCIPTSDSMGIRIVKRRTDTTAFFVYGCYTFDSTLNLVYRADDLDAISKPVYCNHCAFHRFNPQMGRTYSCSSNIDPINNNGQNIVMNMFDEDMNQLKYTWGIINPHHSDMAGLEHTIDFDLENRVYMAGNMETMTNPYIVCLDEDLNKLGEIHFVHPNRSQSPICVLALPEGGCLVSCSAYNTSLGRIEYCVYKVTLSDLLDVEEAHSHGFAVATAYPNPGQSTFNIRTGLQDVFVEVYDMNGRLVHRQKITENGTAINAESWPIGMYVWKMISDGKEVENGKWIKE